jgi:tRNA threonylcarbamoyladenosine biosynthesis protein TsaE
MSVLEQLRSGVSTASAAQTRAIAAAMAAELPAEVTLALHGDLGVGKTTFVQGLALGFGIREPVTSPTFTLYRIYRAISGDAGVPGGRMLAHFDAYRLEGQGQAEPLALEEFLTTPWCLAVEWPDNVASWLPREAWHLHLGIAGDLTHTLKLRGHAATDR